MTFVVARLLQRTEHVDVRRYRGADFVKVGTEPIGVFEL